MTVKKSFINYIDIGSWNIYGLTEEINGSKHYKSNEDEFLQILSKFDILCLQETHCGQDIVNHLTFQGFKLRHFNRPKSSNNRFYGGMPIIFREYISKGISFLSSKDHHDKLWLKLEKSFFGFERDIYLCFIYASPGSSIYTKSLPYDLLQELEKDSAKYKAKGNILIAGDLNTRTSTNCDSVDDFSDKFSPINNIDHYMNDGKGLPRQNMDPSPCDNRGEKILEICKASHMRILNGRFINKTGKLTRFPTKSGDSPSLIDYFIADESMLQYIIGRSIII